MTQDILFALVAFAFVTSITPGPNNVMLMASGANFGFRRSVPHILGISLGFLAMVVVLAVGLAGLIALYPAAQTGLTVLSAIYLTWLAWRLALAPASGEVQGPARPMSFLEAALFQWINPKGWAMGLTAVSLYLPDRSLTGALLVATVFAAVNLPSVSVWALIGTQLRRVLAGGRRLRAFNLTMAGLLAASIWPLVAG